MRAGAAPGSGRPAASPAPLGRAATGPRRPASRPLRERRGPARCGPEPRHWPRCALVEKPIVPGGPGGLGHRGASWRGGFCLVSPGVSRFCGEGNCGAAVRVGPGGAAQVGGSGQGNACPAVRVCSGARTRRGAVSEIQVPAGVRAHGDVPRWKTWVSGVQHPPALHRGRGRPV